MKLDCIIPHLFYDGIDLHKKLKHRTVAPYFALPLLIQKSGEDRMSLTLLSSPIFRHQFGSTATLENPMTEPYAPLYEFDCYISSLFAQEDEILQTVRQAMQREGLPSINVSASEGKLLHLLALMMGARRILEIGTLGGYSAIWLARALPPEGQLISLELDPHHAEVARCNLERAGLAQQVEVRVGAALESLEQMIQTGEALFDLVFIDADKNGYVNYLEKSLLLLRQGGVILADNTLPQAVLDPIADSGTKRYNAAVAVHPDLVSIPVPVLRSRGIDGLSISFKR
jgi:predicted O-methyltransferase YrrM